MSLATNTTRYTRYEDIPQYMTVGEFAKVLDIGTSAAYNIVRSDQIEKIKIGKSYRIPKDELLKLTGKSITTKIEN